MVEYFYIPIEYTTDIIPAINAWTSMPNNGWTIITGIYKKEGYTAGDSLIYNVDVLRRKEFIPLGISVSINRSSPIRIERTLTAICLEGDLDFYSPAFKAQLLALPDVRVFNDNFEYLDFIDSLPVIP